MDSPISVRSEDYIHLDRVIPEMDLGQTHENHPAKVILVHEPDMPIFMGALHPDGSLYENPVNLRKAQAEHRRLVEILEKNGVRAVRIRDVLKANCEENLKERLKLEQLAMHCLTYSLDTKGASDVSHLSDRDKYLMSDIYKEKIISEVNIDQLVDIILTNPTIFLRKADINTALSSTSITFSPLSNLVFCRDQQVTTRKGIVMGQLNSSTRANEIAITEFCFTKLGFKVVGRIPLPGKLEGGDFFPVGDSLCMIGVGLRTNTFAIHYCLDRDLFGTDRVAVVKDCFDWHQERMHLDTIFNIVNYNTCVLLDTVIGEESPIRRLVDVYEKRGPEGKYELVLHDIEFSKYLTQIGFKIIPLTENDQARYGLNFLNIGNGHIITPDMESARKIAKAVDDDSAIVEVVEYKNVSTMYGSVHCSTQVICRDFPPLGDRLADVEAQIAQKTAALSLNKQGVFPSPTEKSSHPQNTDTALMVPPTGFFYNPQAATDNSFMKEPNISKHEIQRAAMKEYSNFHRVLTQDFGLKIHLAINDRLDTPDSVYPNNWFSTHDVNGKPTVVLYPMKHENRRLERIPETIRRINQNYTNIIDFRSAENPIINGDVTTEGTYLEGTGVFVLDRANKIAYLCESPRADPKLAAAWCKLVGYELFDCGVAVDQNGDAVYHTNVVMGIGSKVAIACVESIDATRREDFVEKLSKTHILIDISKHQMHHFCGNVIELWSPKLNAPVMIMSEEAFTHFTQEQKNVLTSNGIHIAHAPIPTIERYGGGGVRCCIAELF